MSARPGACLLLEAGGELFGLDLSLVEAVIPYEKPEPVPFQRPATMGGLLHRGRFMGVADLGRVLELAPLADEGRAVIAVIESQGAYVGLAAAASRGLLRAAEMGEEAKVIGKWEGHHHLFSLQAGEEVVHLLDMDSLLTDLHNRVERAT